MNQQTIDLVQQSWVKVAAIAPQAAALFYQNLSPLILVFSLCSKGPWTNKVIS
ncbi:MAG: hypothetical protein HGB05_15060 [Chloroflexi bacterium]|nr:hypothetical protein [Chloroflexota bacterium]